MKYDYYLHRSRGKIGDYFGDIGEPFKISWLWYIIMTIWGPLTGKPYRRTIVPAGSPLSDVIVKALENDETHITSHKAYETLKEYCGDEVAINITGTDPFGLKEKLSCC